MSGPGDESAKEFSEKLKKATKQPDWASNCAADVEAKYYLQLSPNYTQQLSAKNTDRSNRLLAIQQLTDVVKTKVIRESQVEDIWRLVQDLLQGAEVPKEERNAAIMLMAAVATTSSASKYLGGAMRHIMVGYVIDKHSTEDTTLMFDLLSGALDEGKALELVEDLVGQFYNSWYPTLLKSNRVKEAIMLFVNLIKMNAAYLDEPELLGLVKSTVSHLNCTMCEEEAMCCLSVIESLVAYCHLPSATIKPVIMSIAQIVSVPTHTERVWKMMRSILGTNIGLSALFSLFDIIVDESIRSVHIIRGCVYFLHMSLWGVQPVASLDIPFHFALPILEKASCHDQELVIYETAFAMKTLTNKVGPEIHPQAWETVFSIVSNIYKAAISMSDYSKAQAILNVVNDTVDIMEHLRDQDQLCVMKEKFYSFLLPYSLLRSETSTLHIMNFLAKHFTDVDKEDDWLEKLKTVFDQYINKDTRAAVKVTAAEWMTACRKRLSKDEGTLIVQEIVLPFLQNYRSQTLVVRCSAVDVLGDIAYNHNHSVLTECLKLLILTVSESFDVEDDDITEYTPETAADIVKAIDWLLLIFKRRIWDLPSTDALLAFKALLLFLRKHYNNPSLFEGLNDSRYKIIETIFHIRANEHYHIGLPEVEDAQLNYGFPPLPGVDQTIVPRFTPYIVIDHKHGKQMFTPEPTETSSSSGSAEQGASDDFFSCASLLDGLPKSKDEWRERQKHRTITYLSLTEAANIVLHAMKIEKDWNILKLMFEGIPKMLQNKSLVVSRNSNDINRIVETLASIISNKDPTYIPSLYNTSTKTSNKFLRPDFEKYAFQALSCLSCYYEHLTLTKQNLVVNTLISGMVYSKCTAVCISALTLCCLEMQQPMIRALPHVLTSLTKTSATVYTAQPVLEFLSTLLHLPKIYSNFSSEQYRYVFAVVIPYTHPVKFNQYIVILAFHVLAMWFLKCRLMSRWNFVNYISKNLKNVLGPEEQHSRRRSSSLNTEQLATTERNEKFLRMHDDMRIILNDLMARYSFSSCTPMARRSEVGEALVGAGQQQTWLIGQKLCTITTSGCTLRPITPGGVCESCMGACAALLRPLDELSEESSSNKTSKSNSASNLPTIDDLQSNESSASNSNLQPLDSTSLAVGVTVSPSSMSQQTGSSGDSSASASGGGAKEIKDYHLCACWCIGYSEVYFRQPTGNTVWMMRIQNRQQVLDEGKKVAIDNLSTLYGPNITPKTGLIVPEEPQHNILDEPSLEPIASSDNSVMEDAAADDQSAIHRSLSNPEMKDGVPAASAATAADDSVFVADVPQAGVSGGSTSPAVPQSPSKRFPRLNKFNSNLNKFFGNPSHPSSSGPSSPKITSEADGRRRRIPSAVLPSSSSSSHPNVASLSGSGAAAPQATADEGDIAPARRGRVHTISVMSPVSLAAAASAQSSTPTSNNTPPFALTQPKLSEIFAKPWSRPQPGTTTSDPKSSKTKDSRGGVSPSNVLLQLFYNGSLDKNFDRPLLIPNEATDFMRTITVLDQTPPLENHKIGVLYIGEGQNKSSEYLGNLMGSTRYSNFLSGLGTSVPLKKASKGFYLPGLSDKGDDGDECYVWQDEIMQVAYHVATIMPNKPNEPEFTSKKRHIGNDFVCIVYNDSGVPYDVSSFRTAFHWVVVEITPLDHCTNTVNMLMKSEAMKLLPTSPVVRLVTDTNLAVYVRQLALHAEIACQVQRSINTPEPYAGNWLLRLRTINRLRGRLLEKLASNSEYDEISDFVDILGLEQ